MGKRDLPPETHQALDYNLLVSTLETIDGEPVIVRPSRRDEAAPAAGIASMVGVLQQTKPTRYPGREFSIGSPYPDRYPEHLAGGIIFLDTDSFEAANLRTFDGNDYFAVSVTTRPVEILIQDQNSTYP